jgi:phospholipid transport system substrate-binding protein
MRAYAVRLSAVMLLGSIAAQAVHAETPPADQVVRETATAAMAEIRQRSEELANDPASLYALVEQRLLPNFDINLISRQVLGRHWTQANPEQRARFIAAFQRMLIRTYAKALLTFKDGSFEWLPLSAEPDTTDATVRSTITQGDTRLSVQYKMRLVDERWLVYDITIDGVSLVTNYRGIFNSEIRRSNIQDVIDRLEQKAAS